MDGLLVFFIIYLLLLSLLCIVGSVLNLYMLVVLCLESGTRTPQGILLKNLCISNVVYLVGGPILIVMVAVIGHEIMCFITIGFVCFVIALNVYLVAALKLQRYISRRKFRNVSVFDEKERKYSLWIAFGIWVLAAVLAVIEYSILRPDAETCMDDLLMGVPLYRLLMYVVLPIAIVKVLEIAINRLSAPTNEAIVREMEIQRMQFKLVLLCFLTYSPAIVVAYIIAAHMDKEYRLLILPFGSMLTTLNAFFQPIVMCIVSKKLRKLLKDYCCCRCCWKPDTSHQFNTEVNRVIMQRTEQC